MMEIYEKELSDVLVNCALEVRNELGSEMLERVYEEALRTELALNGVSCVTQVPVIPVYKGIRLDRCPLRMDMVVVGKILVELKAVRFLTGVEFRQLLTYMKLTGFKVGYLINFGALDFRPARKYEKTNYELGIYRVVV